MRPWTRKKNPYQSPHPIDIAASFQHGRWVRPYASGHTRALLVMSLLAVTMILLLLFLVCGIVGMQLWRRALYGTPDEFESAIHCFSSIAPAASWLPILLVAVSLATSVAFLMWIHRAYRNLPALRGTPLKCSPRWAVGYYFIPILNFFRPYQVMKEIWRESDPRGYPCSAKHWRRPKRRLLRSSVGGGRHSLSCSLSAKPHDHSVISTWPVPLLVWVSAWHGL